jgi:Fanconi anemia group M protein
MIVVDDREVKSGVIEALRACGMSCETRRLDVADYLVNETVLVERKTVPDFIESLNDLRLFDQVARLRDGNKRAVMIIEGAHLPGNARVRGVLCSLAASWYLPVLRSVDAQGTAWVLKHIHDQQVNQAHAMHEYDCRAKRNGASLEARMLMQIRSIGPETAQMLLNRFDSLAGILSATQEEILSVKNIGPFITQQIQSLKGSPSVTRKPSSTTNSGAA